MQTTDLPLPARREGGVTQRGTDPESVRAERRTSGPLFVVSTPAAHPVSGGATVTPAERRREALRLRGRGRTFRQIAAELRVSVSTIQRDLEGDIKSRRERAIRDRLLGPPNTVHRPFAGVDRNALF